MNVIHLFIFKLQSRDEAKISVHVSPFITLCLGSIGMDTVLSELCYKGTILQKEL